MACIKAEGIGEMSKACQSHELEWANVPPGRGHKSEGVDVKVSKVSEIKVQNVKFPESQ